MQEIMPAQSGFHGAVFLHSPFFRAINTKIEAQGIATHAVNRRELFQEWMQFLRQISYLPPGSEAPFLTCRKATADPTVRIQFSA
jgi:hypothetical protein